MGRNKRELAEQVSRCKPVNVSLEAYKKTCLVGTSEDLSNRISEFINLGVSFFMLVFVDLLEMKSLRIFGEEFMKLF